MSDLGGAEHPTLGTRWGAPEAWLVLIASEFVLMVSGLIAQGGASEISITRQFVALVPFWLFAVLAARYVVTRDGGNAVRELGLHAAPVDLPIGLVAGIATQLLVLPLLYWPLLRLLHSNTDELERVAQKLGDASRGTLGTMLLVVMTCVAAPIVEEVLYRGLLMGSLARRNRGMALVVSAAVFAALHFQPLQFVGLFVFGLIAGALVLRTGRLGTSIAAHMAFNAATVVTLLLQR